MVNAWKCFWNGFSPASIVVASRAAYISEEENSESYFSG